MGRLSARTSPRAATELLQSVSDGEQSLAKFWRLCLLELSIKLVALVAFDGLDQELARRLGLFQVPPLGDATDLRACFGRDVEIQALHEDTFDVLMQVVNAILKEVFHVVSCSEPPGAGRSLRLAGVIGPA